jgi:hypothetical protein
MSRKSFPARKADGTIVNLVVIQNPIPAGTLNDPSATEPGLLELRTAEGRAINRVSKGIYETLDGDRLTSDHPLAP